MKKILLSFIMLLACTVGFAGVQQVCGVIQLQIGFDDPTNGEEPLPKTLPAIPAVMQNDYEIRFLEVHPYYTLCIVDEDDEVVYSVAVWSFTTSIVLPSWLSGDYEIQLRPDENYYLYGYIEL